MADLVTKFEVKFTPEPNTGCWLWNGPHNLQGYGRFTISRKSSIGYRTQAAHRFSWLLYRGPIENDFWVLHKCDTPACVNPDHLFLGTRTDNVHDMAKKGRVRRQNSRHCINDHEMAGNNLIRKKGIVAYINICRKCNNEAQRKYQHKKIMEKQYAP